MDFFDQNSQIAQINSSDFRIFRSLQISPFSDSFFNGLPPQDIDFNDERFEK